MLAARRQAERARLRRRRNLTFGSLGIVVAAVLVIVGINLWTSKGHPVAASSLSPSASATPSTGPSPCGIPKVPAAASQTKPTFAKAPPMTIDTRKTYTATFETSCGTFTAELLPKASPIGVNSFVFLANKGFFDGLKFHRIVSGFVIQGGDPKGDGTGGPGYDTPVTVSKGVTFSAAGLLAYAHSSTGGNGSQFFVTLAATPSLNPSTSGKYTIFGKVTKGLDVVTKIGSVPTVPSPVCPTGESCSPTEPIYIDKVTITEK
jgi:cyclophilin family peptidyl-prolyl cis-trans isomerase